MDWALHGDQVQIDDRALRGDRVIRFTTTPSRAHLVHGLACMARSRLNVACIVDHARLM
jgi:hypothetical protein